MADVSAMALAITKSRRISDRIVILCEGDPPETSMISPQTYRRVSRLPDANFYKACVPRRWGNFRTPVFFNCGGRPQVIETYRQTLSIHNSARGQSYLDPKKLYALVDLDIQTGYLPEGYPWRTTEDVHECMYDNGMVRESIDPQHRILVTSVVHKEAYFVWPSLRLFLESELHHLVRPFYGGAPFSLDAFYDSVIASIPAYQDICENLHVVKSRLRRFLATCRAECDTEQSVRDIFAEHSGSARNDYVAALLSVAKVKAEWSKIVPEPREVNSMQPGPFQDQLALGIAALISDADPSEHPLAGFFDWIDKYRY